MKNSELKNIKVDPDVHAGFKSFAAAQGTPISVLASAALKDWTPAKFRVKATKKKP